MNKQASRPSSAKRRPQARKGRTAVAAKTARKGTDRTAWIIVAIVIAIGGSLVFVFASGANKSSGPKTIHGRQDAPASLVKAVTSIPADTLSKVGGGSASVPKKLPGPPLVTKDGKPRIVYVGAEYCPFCATERWAMVNALSRFGTFSNLSITTSAKITPSGVPESFPNTPTFSFYKSTYKSDYISFEPVEEHNQAYQPLETPTAEQSQLVNTYNAPPYVAKTDAGAIPFIDFANQYLISGASYDAQVLQGKNFDEVAAAMKDPTTDISKGAVGTANVITATICATTQNKPTNVCSDPVIQGIQSQLPK